jgi:hypothetical protein
VATNVVAELVKILPPPAAPIDSDESALQRNEQALRIKFPHDFLEFGRIYGSGTIRCAYSWEVWSPFRKTYPLIVLEFARICNIFKAAMEVNDVPFGIFPEEGGVLPFAMSPGGDWVCWQTGGDPDDWHVVDLYQYEDGSYEKLELGFSEYFVSVLTRKVTLRRHQDGDNWDPSKDLQFTQDVNYE